MEEGELLRALERMEGRVEDMSAALAEHRREVEKAWADHRVQMVNLTGAITAGQSQILAGIQGMTTASDALHDAVDSIRVERSTKEWDMAMARKEVAGEKPTKDWIGIALLVLISVIAVIALGEKGPEIVTGFAKLFVH